MSARIKRATITIDDAANDLFPKQGAEVKGYPTILDELQRRLQDKGDDPEYDRVIFAVDGQDKYVEINDRDIRLAGVFTRGSGTRYDYGEDNIVIRSALAVNIRDTLVVANNENIAKMWEKELASLGYETRVI